MALWMSRASVAVSGFYSRVKLRSEMRPRYNKARLRHAWSGLNSSTTGVKGQPETGIPIKLTGSVTVGTIRAW